MRSMRFSLRCVMELMTSLMYADLVEEEKQEQKANLKTKKQDETEDEQYFGSATEAEEKDDITFHYIRCFSN